MISGIVEKIRNNPLVSVFLLVAAVVGGVVKIVDFGHIYHESGLPRWAWQSDITGLSQEIQQSREMLTRLEIDYRQNQLRADQRLLRETQQQKQHSAVLDPTAADGLAELEALLQNNIAQQEARLAYLSRQQTLP